MNVTYVDDLDRVIGGGSVEKSIKNGIAVRVVRIFVVNSRNELLIQKRSQNISIPNKWDLSAAGHVDEGEEYDQAAARELSEEMGINNIELRRLDVYYIEGKIPSGIKKMFNGIYHGVYDGKVTISPSEVSDYKWIDFNSLQREMSLKPDDFTDWFRFSLKRYLELIS